MTEIIASMQVYRILVSLWNKINPFPCYYRTTFYRINVKTSQCAHINSSERGYFPSIEISLCLSKVYGKRSVKCYLHWRDQSPIHLKTIMCFDNYLILAPQTQGSLSLTPFYTSLCYHKPNGICEVVRFFLESKKKNQTKQIESFFYAIVFARILH